MPVESREVVVNTSPLIALGACDQIDLLHRLHPRVIIPEAVHNEVFSGLRSVGNLAFDLPPWMEVLELQQAPSRLLLAHLDEGEAAVIALALEVGCRLVVIDERRGRTIARLMGLITLWTRRRRFGSLMS